MPPLLVIFAAAACLIVKQLRLVSLPIVFLAAFAVLYILYIVLVGGDYLVGPFRFMAPLVPSLGLLIYHCGVAMAERKEKWLRDLCGCLVFFSIFQFGYLESNPGKIMGAVSGLAVKDYIASHWPTGSLIALNVAGALPYYDTNYRYIDMLGLSDRHIARRKVPRVQPELGQVAVGHLKGDGDYVLSRRPDYVIFGYCWGNADPVFLSDHELAKNPEFWHEYEKVEVYITPPPNLVEPMSALENGGRTDPVLDANHRLRFVYFQRRK
jgi:hypothetical protein